MYAFLGRNGRALLVTLGALVWAALPFAVFAQTRTEIPAVELSATMESGFARLVFTFPEEIKTEVQLSDSNVLVIRFAKPMRVAVDRVQAQFKDFVQAARADPDGTAVRIAFLHKLTVNTMEAGEKLFVDLLPQDWTGLPPGLPQEVVDELARRARDAEQRIKAAQQKAKVWQPIRLRLADAPTFSRFAFSMSEPVKVRAEQDGQELKIVFEAPVKIDLGDALGALPKSVVSLDTDYAEGIAIARLVLAPQAKVRHFREQSAFIVDVTPPPVAKPDEVQGEVPPPARQAETPPQAPQAPAKQEQPAKAQAPAEAQTPKAVTPEVPAQAKKQEVLAPVTNDVRATVTQVQNGVRLYFPFQEPVASAVFRRGDRVWIAFDTKREIDVSELAADVTRSFSDVTIIKTNEGQLLRLRLKGGWLTSAESDGKNWTIHFGDAVTASTRPLSVQRTSEETGAALAVPVEEAAKGKVHRVADPDIGDELFVVTALNPVRGILRAQDFVEFRLLPSAHGVAVLPLADDLKIELRSDYVIIGRPKGLSLSTAPDTQRAPAQRLTSSPLDAALWEAERNRRYQEREVLLAAAALNTDPTKKLDSRLTLATFYLAHGLAAEAKGALDALVREDNKFPVNARFFLLRGLSELMIGRPAKALDNFANLELADSQDAALLRAVAYADIGAWSEARDQFRAGNIGLKLLPLDLQRRILFAALRAAVEVRDFTEANRLFTELDATEVPAEMAAEYAVLAGHLAQGLGRADRAESFFETAAKSENRPAAAEARYKLVELKYARGELSRTKAIESLESLAFLWRGDRTELESSRMLARFYVEEARYRDAFRLLDAALLSQANASVTRTLQNEMSQVFEDLFLSGKADALPAIDALALYYDFSKLTPVGRRGDELIRRLADRLVAVDLLDQATELLQYQVEYRLTGAARAQVATRLAIIHLMNRKPQRAVAILAGTRMADLPKELREQRMLLESRALMSANRIDQALDLIASLDTPEAQRQRADTLFHARRWRAAGEAIEAMLGERWKEEEALSEIERHDVLRAGLAFALADEKLGLARLKEKFAGKLTGAAEKEAFDQITLNPSPRAIGAASKILANLDSLGTFLKIYHARYPSTPPAPARADQLSAR
jgi:hypothetical protein